MTMRTFARLVGSSLIVTSSMVACSGAKMEHRPAIAAAQAGGIAMSIEKALAKRDFARALLDAERLVAAEPRSGAYRALLGRAYLFNGRYASARTAFEDALTLGANDHRTLVSLALVHVGLNDAGAARALLSQHISDMPAADYGLAMAMAGDANEGVRALLEAVDMPDATARTRQNLAYALALSGQWGQARLIAGQDLAGAQLQARLTQWAATATADAMPQRVAALTGVAPRADDAGLPQHLALANSDPAALASTVAPEAKSDLVSDAADGAGTSNAGANDAMGDAAAQPAPMEVASADAAPLIRAPLTPMREAAQPRVADPSTSAKIKVQTDARMPAARAVSAPQAAEPVEDAPPAAKIDSDWVVQIGAFGDARSANRAWQRMGRKGENRFRRIEGTVAVNGRTFHRVAMGGFAGRAGAMQLCLTLRARGQSCFVRRDAGLATEIRMARAATRTRIASR